MTSRESLRAARGASDEPCACDRYPYCGCGRKPRKRFGGDVAESNAPVAPGEVQGSRPAVTADELRAIVDSADRFARFDPGVDWPSDKHTDPVDAICAAFDAIREALAVEVDR